MNENMIATEREREREGESMRVFVEIGRQGVCMCGSRARGMISRVSVRIEIDVNLYYISENEG